METRERINSINDQDGGDRRILRHAALRVASAHWQAAAHLVPGSAERMYDPASPPRPARVRDRIAASLTGRQQEVLALMAEGWSNAAIARRLFVTERAVIQHVSNIYDQLGLPVSEHDHRRVLAVLCYLDR
jgi:DNA-binding NarL/FixJ family response regulator